MISDHRSLQIRLPRGQSERQKLKPTHSKYKLMGVNTVRRVCVRVCFLSRSPPTSQWFIPSADPPPTLGVPHDLLLHLKNLQYDFEKP